MSFDPLEIEAGDNRENQPEYTDENPNLELIRQGMEVSESERRDAADDEFGLDPSLPISDEYPDGDEMAPEIAAIHEEIVPLDDEDDEL